MRDKLFSPARYSSGHQEPARWWCEKLLSFEHHLSRSAIPQPSRSKRLWCLILPEFFPLCHASLCGLLIACFLIFFWFNLSAFRLAPPPRGMRLPPEGEPCFLHAFTDYSTSVDGIFPHDKLLETFLYVSPRISTNWLLPWRYPHGTTRTRPIVHSATYLFQYTIYCPVRGRTVASIAFILFRTEIRFNSTCFVDGDTK